MSKYRVHLSVRRPDNKGGTMATVNVEADIDFTAMEIAKQQFHQSHPNYRDYTVNVIKVEKKG